MAAYTKKLEALAEAITSLSGYRLPDGALYQARNPGGLKATLPEHPKTPEGIRVYRSFLDGYQSLLSDLQVKISGKSRSRLTPSSPLSDLSALFGVRETRAVVLFLRAALSDPSLTANTPLSYFSEN